MSRNLVLRILKCSRPMPLAAGHFLRLQLVGASAAAALLAAGCSADISRFDGQGYGLTDSKSATIPPQGMRTGEPQKLGDAGQDYGQPQGGAYYPPAANRPGNNGGVRSATLPEPIAPLPPPTASPPPQRSASIAPRPAAGALMQPKPVAHGATIDVVHGDTLFGLAKKHAVTVNELMSVNSLTSPNLKPGQKLVLPASRSMTRTLTAQRPLQRPERVASLPQTNAAAPATSIPAPTDWGGQHVVRSGDSLYAIARSHKISLVQLQQVNGIADPTKVKPGVVLKVPGAVSTAAVEPAPIAPIAPAPKAQVAGAVATTETPRIAQSATKPVIINQTQPAPQQIAAVEPAEKPAESSPAPKSVEAVAGGLKLRWPVKGRIIATYGPKPDNMHNDGINIAVPMGTEVLAAEHGVVAYAGSELKGYGNLILLRHDNGWVTAYAHNEELMVKRGDKVKRGQPIAKAGKSGTVDQPQVHFEVRQGQKPVDPMPFLERI